MLPATVLESQLPFEEVTIADGVGVGIDRVPVLSYRIPDLVVTTRREIEDDSAALYYLWTPPLLVAECLSPSDRKASLVKLMREYQSIRVSEAWDLEPEQERLSCYTPDAPAPLLHSGDDIVSLIVFPAVQVPLRELWDAFRGRQNP